MTDQTPNPGSDEALKLGCRCPRMDNHYGAGVPSASGEPNFWMVEDCPLHGLKKNRNET